MKLCKVYSARKSRRDKTLEKCRKMREAKERKRLAHSECAVFAEIGRAVFSGPAFGDHTVRIISRTDAPFVCEFEVDGKATCVKTQRGARALLMRRIAGEVVGGDVSARAVGKAAVAGERRILSSGIGESVFRAEARRCGDGKSGSGE